MYNHCSEITPCHILTTREEQKTVLPFYYLILHIVFMYLFSEIQLSILCIVLALIIVFMLSLVCFWKSQLFC